MADETDKARIKELEEELTKTPYNKRTQHHVGLIKAKIARLKEKVEKKGGGKKGEGYNVRKTGDITAVLVGFPSVGKSTLLNKLTNAKSKIGEYDFTTLNVVPGLMEYNHAKIQILDIPGLIEYAAHGSGRGKEVLSVVRTADLILILVDVFDLNQANIIKKELYNANIRIDQKKPDIKIVKGIRGGLNVSLPKNPELSEETVRSIMNEYKLVNGLIMIRDNITVDQLIDFLEGNRVYTSSITIINKTDLADKAALERARLIPNSILVSAEKEINLDMLRERIFEKSGLIRIYLKQIGKKADMKEPLIVKEGCTVRDICNKIHRDFVSKFRFARIWGSTKFPGQKQSLDYTLHDKDIVQLHLV